MKNLDKIKRLKMFEDLGRFLRRSFGDNFCDSFRVIAISCLQFGDTGKGKIVHLLAWLWAQIIVRCGGGDNAGHTVIHNGKEMVFHLLPSGIAFDNEGIINVIGSGTVIYLKALVDEIKLLWSQGLTCNNLKIALNAKLILPHHILLDRFGELNAGKAKIGTTGKGIGPCYTDFTDRKGLILNDVLNPEIFRAKLQARMEPILKTLSKLDEYSKNAIKVIMFHEHLEKGLYYSEDSIFNVETIIMKYLEYGDFLRTYIQDTDSFVRTNLGKKNILLEGAQGLLLSVDHGTYPFVTSSDCSPAGMAKGAGLLEENIDVSFGIIKGLYMTRVGKGPFPTEMGGSQSEIWCNDQGSRKKEEEMYGDADINDVSEYLQGIALRRIAGEYGATTGRPRRTGWIDLPLLRHALDFGAQNIILTKLDVLTGVNTIKICYAYEYIGPDYCYSNITLTKGMIIPKVIPIPEIMDNCEPIYMAFPGWKKNIRDCRRTADLPKNLRIILKYIFESAEIKGILRIVSVGPGPEETVFINNDDL